MLEGKHEKKQRADQARRCREDDHRTAVEAIGDQTRRHRKQQLGKKTDQAHESKIEGLMTDSVDLPGNRGIGDAFGKPAALTSDEIGEEG